MMPRLRGSLKVLCRRAAVVAVAACVVSGCAVNPVTGARELMLVSEQDELRLGQSTDQSVTRQYGLYDDPALQQYLQAMGSAMGRSSHRPQLAWTFKVMDSPVVNAFAAPGGYVYVTRGLLAAANNEAELAGVLGHEIGHVTARHSARQYSSQLLTGFGLELGQALLGGYGDAMAPLLKAGAGLLFLKYSRDDEREADGLGVSYATQAGYDAGRIADFFVTLQRQPGSGGGQRLPEFFSTHPNPVNREATVRAAARQLQDRTPDRQYRVGRDAFLQRIDGLVYGDDPRQGFREGDWYYLPQYRVQLPIPAGWSLEREGNSIQMLHPEQRAVSIFQVQPDSRVEEALSAFLESTGAAVQQERSLTISGMPGKEVLSSLVRGTQRSVVVSRFLQKGADVFAFHGMTADADYATFSGPMQQPAEGFGPITRREILERQPRRIVIRTLQRAVRLDSALSSFGIEQSLWDELAWLNGRQLGDLLGAGTKIKVLR